MAAASFKIDPAGLRRLLSEGQAVAVLKERADAMIAEAGRVAPRGFMGYKKSLTVGEPVSDDGVPVVPAGSSSSGWHLVEFGSANNAPMRVLERAARAVGLDWRPGR